MKIQTQNQKNKNGFSMVEALLAAVLLAVVILGTFGIFTTYIKFASSKSRSITLANEIEGTIVAATQDIELIRPYADSLFLGTPPTDFTITDPADPNFVIAKQNTLLMFTSDKKACTDLTQCALSTIIDIRCSPASPYPDCRLAYQIKFLNQGNSKIEYQSLGAPNYPFTDPDDYFVILAYDVFAQGIDRDCSSSSFLTGYDKNSGNIYCATTPQPPADSAPPNTLPIGMSLIPSAGGGGTLIMSHVPFRTATCPENYALSEMSSLGLDSRGTGSVTCVFVGKKSVPWRNFITQAPPIQSTPVCPNHYETTTPSCTVNWQDIPVTCPVCSCNCSGGNLIGGPGNWSVLPVICDTCGGNTLHPVHGNCITNNNKQFVTAYIQYLTQAQCECNGDEPVSIATSITLNGTEARADKSPKGTCSNLSPAGPRGFWMSSTPQPLCYEPIAAPLTLFTGKIKGYLFDILLI